MTATPQDDNRNLLLIADQAEQFFDNLIERLKTSPELTEQMEAAPELLQGMESLYAAVQARRHGDVPREAVANVPQLTPAQITAEDAKFLKDCGIRRFTL